MRPPHAAAERLKGLLSCPARAGGSVYDPRGRVAEMVMMKRSTCILVADYLSAGLAVTEPSLILASGVGAPKSREAPLWFRLMSHGGATMWCLFAAVSHVRWE